MTVVGFRIAAAGAFTLAAFTLACHATQTATVIAVAPPENTAPASNVSTARPPKLVGSYLCAISMASSPYPPFRCGIRNVGGHLELAKLGGSQRFVGRITPDATNDFDFRGKYFCPMGACDQPLVGHFHREPSGAYTGQFSDDNLGVQLVPMALAKGVFGDAAYGAATYGGADYATPLQQPAP